MSSFSALPVAAPYKIDLEEREEKIFSLFDDVCKWIAEKGRENQPVELRIAGGWVRDKLLGQDSEDLDVSVSTLTGVAFASHLQAYLREKGMTGLLSSVHDIPANPEQSKHLETATSKLMGKSVDFVNLRKEVYEPGSRIPKMTFGTPLEDAERRDTTINSLFYNVHTRRVEDFTGKGLDDLRAGLIRTPLPPLRTFHDDPLRILRCVRFASRFGYRLDEEIVECLTGEGQDGGRKEEVTENGELLTTNEIRTALATKVSRERVGIEVDKMMKGPRPLDAILLLYRLGLYPLVFARPLNCTDDVLFTVSSSPSPQDDGVGTVSARPPSAIEAVRVARTVDGLMRLAQGQAQDEKGKGKGRAGEATSTKASSDVMDTTEDGVSSATVARATLSSSSFPRTLALHPTLAARLLEPSVRRKLFLAAGMADLRGLWWEEKKGRKARVVDAVVKDGLKLGNNDKVIVSSLHASAELLRFPRLSRFGRRPESSVGLLLRSQSLSNRTLGLRYLDGLLFSLACELSEVAYKGNANAEEGDDGWDEERAREVLEGYAEFVDWVEREGMEERSAEKPRLDGNRISSVLSLRPSPLTVRITQAVLAYQFEHPTASADEVAAWLASEWEQGGVVEVEERRKVLDGPGSGGAKGKKRKGG